MSIIKQDSLPDADGNIGKGLGFHRIRRITGYLVGDVSRFNNAKRAEERDRVKHGFVGKAQSAQSSIPESGAEASSNIIYMNAVQRGEAEAHAGLLRST